MITPLQLARQAIGGVTNSLVLAMEKLVDLPRNIKQACLLLLDMVFVSFAIYAGIALRYMPQSLPPEVYGPLELSVFAVTIVVSAIIFMRLGLYRAVIRFMGQKASLAIILGVTFSTMILSLASLLVSPKVPNSLPVIYWGLALFFIGGTRVLVRFYYQGKLQPSCENVVIYGAGESGRQLLTALNHDEQLRIVYFVDDDIRLQRTVINGVPVISPAKLVKLVRSEKILQVLLAMPVVSAERRKEIINSLVGLPVKVKTVPKFTDLLQGRARVGQIQEIDLEDLLGRLPVPPHPELVDRCITGKVVMVTGAGGSIGSELCRQIVLSRPGELVLLDSSEYALYNIERELNSLLKSSGANQFEIVPLLGSVQDQRRLQQIFQTFSVDTVYHAAAYKHVPLVEYNIAEGVANNIFGTWYAAQAAIATGVENFVLISTDKAVRPTNIMGASKRFAEMLCQALATAEGGTRFCMVRFGNVLGSSGSVVPLFREQIRAGGPVTVTHAEVTRYFMTIPEAAQLVVQASAMGQGGDVFVLDMGEPVRILDLAHRMIHLSGYGIKDEDNPLGQIEIQYTGLRPGEKLYEELLLGVNVLGTGHPMIMRAEEEYPALEELQAWLEQLRFHCDHMDCDGIKDVLLAAVSGFEEHTGMHDHVWKKQRALTGDSPSNVQPLFPGKSAD